MLDSAVLKGDFVIKLYSSIACGLCGLCLKIEKAMDVKLRQVAVGCIHLRLSPQTQRLIESPF